MAQRTVQEANRRAMEFLRAGKRSEAEAIAHQVLEQVPRNAAALHCLGLIAQSAGRFHDAATLIHQAIEADGGIAEYHYNLSVALAALGDTDSAITELREAIRLQPGLSEAHSNLGGLLSMTARLDEAESALREAIRLRPEDPWAHVNLGKVLRSKDQLDPAESELRTAISLAPANPHPWNMLGSCLREAGRIGPAIDAFRNALRIKPDFQEAHDNLCYALYLDPLASPGQILAEHRRWGVRFADPFAARIGPWANDPNPHRRLRIGYVSPDFYGHCQSLFTIPLLEHHDRQAFEIFAYSNVAAPDAISRQIRDLVDGWRDIHRASDDGAAQMIRQDRIDILVDLTVHMAGNRLPVFARKPAPVQITWLGYPGTTGVGAIDYRLSDPYLDPPESNDAFYTEKTVRLAHTFWCYRPFSEEPSIGPLPALSNGHITFGCLNSLAKVSEPTFVLWAQVLRALPTSRVVVRASPGSPRQRVLGDLRAGGIDAGRIDFVDRRPQLQYMELYNRIDISLDTMPYSGHTTSMDSFWMGVPVVTLPGPTVVSRGGVSILSNLGLESLIAGSVEQYVGIVRGLARDLPRLMELRSTLRQRMRSSPLMNAPLFARDMEAAYRQVWQDWCRERVAKVC